MAAREFAREFAGFKPIGALARGLERRSNRQRLRAAVCNRARLRRGSQYSASPTLSAPLAGKRILGLANLSLICSLPNPER
jgi:hypothetical protein